MIVFLGRATVVLVVASVDEQQLLKLGSTWPLLTAAVIATIVNAQARRGRQKCQLRQVERRGPVSVWSASSTAHSPVLLLK